MAITYGYFDSINGDRKYNADQMSEYFDGIVSDGVFQSVGGALAVSAQSTPDMSVKVVSGRAIINSKWIKNDADIILPITAASTAYARITSVVVQLDPANRLIRITTKDGTPSGSPVAPEITENELEIARITVAANATSIADSAITDKREYVHGVITEANWGGIGGNIANQSDLQNSLGLINARIDNIIALTPGSTTGDAELADIRVGADGVTYPNAGDAVRGQYTKNKNLIDTNVDKLGSNISKVNSIATKTRGGVTIEQVENISYIVENGWIQMNGTLDPDYYYHIGLSVQKGEIYKIKSRCGGTFRAYVFVVNGTVKETYKEQTWLTDNNFNIEFVVPEDGTLFINSHTNSYIGVGKIGGYNNNISELGNIATQDFNSLKWETIDIYSEVEKTLGFVQEDANNYKKLEKVTSSSFFYKKIEILPNTIYKIFGMAIQYLKAFYITDENDIILYSCNETTSQNLYKPICKTLLTASNAKYLYMLGSNMQKKTTLNPNGGGVKNSECGILLKASNENKGVEISGYMNTNYDTVFQFNLDAVSSYKVKVLPISKGEKWYCKNYNYYNLVGWTFLKNNGEIVKTSHPTTGAPSSYTEVNGVCEALEDGFLILSTSGRGWDYTFYQKVKNDSCFGKKWYVIGDSFTDPATLENKESKFNYVDYVAGFLGLENKNVGNGGSGYKAPDSGAESRNFVNRALGCAGYDLVTVFGSFNDIATTLPLGTVTDTGTDTLAGRMYNTIKNIRDTQEDATIVIIAPSPWISQNQVTGNAWGNIPNENYVEMLRSICKRYNVCFANPYHEGGAYPWDWHDGETVDYTFLIDGTHYNSIGHKKFIAPIVIDGILKAFRQN